MTLDDDLPPILTVEQTATILGISRGLAFAAVRTGEIPHVRIGRRILVSRDMLRSMLSSQRSSDVETAADSRMSARRSTTD